MTFQELSLKIQEILRPFHSMPAIATLPAYEWLNRGLDAEKQILPLIEETIARKLAKKEQVPTNLKYYDAVLKKIEPLKKEESKKEVDKQAIREWKIKMGLYVA